MLFGREASSVKNDTSPHFQLAKEGVMFAKGADILYNDKDCMTEASLQADCQQPNMTFYQVRQSQA